MVDRAGSGLIADLELQNQRAGSEGGEEEEEHEEEEEDEETWMRRKHGGTRMDDIKRWLAISFFVFLGMLVIIAALTAAPLILEEESKHAANKTSPP